MRLAASCVKLDLFLWIPRHQFYAFKKTTEPLPLYTCHREFRSKCPTLRAKEYDRSCRLVCTQGAPSTWLHAPVSHAWGRTFNPYARASNRKANHKMETTLPANASLLHRLHRASQIATDLFTREIGTADLTVRQVVVLAAFAADEGASQTAIVEASGIDRSTLADIVKRLVTRGLLSRRRDKNDARANIVKLTAEGQRVLATAMPIMASVEAAMLAALPMRKRTELVAMLETLTHYPTLAANKGADNARGE